MIVKMIPDYGKIKNLRSAFYAKEDFSDVPNFDLSSPCKKVEKTEDGNLRLELAKPLAKDYPTGTAIRFHSVLRCIILPMAGCLQGRGRNVP